MRKRKQDITKEEKKAVREARKLVENLYEMDGNEAETRRRVERILESITGYDSFKHLSRERAIQGSGEIEHVDFSIQLSPGRESQPIVLVELKRVGLKLAKKHLKQVTSYSIDTGCEWILLTNGREWCVYHVEFLRPPKVELLDRWNLLEDKIDDLVLKFDFISLKSLKKGLLDRQWQRVKALAPAQLLGAIITDENFNVIKRNLRRDTNIRVDNEELYNGIGRLLNEAAGKVMDNIKVPMKKTKKKQKKEVKTDKK
jgi:predicted type IV restriction endonuclease